MTRLSRVLARVAKLAVKQTLLLKTISLTTLLFTYSSIAIAALAPEDIEPPTSLKGKVVPEPTAIKSLVKNKQAAIALGKALFWEPRVSSDGKKACATCHFSAGADNRIKNQLAPAPTKSLFHNLGPNLTLKKSDFPLTTFSSILKTDNDEAPVKDVRDVVGSQGVFFEKLISVTPGASADVTSLIPDPLFKVGNLNVHRVTGRNAPTNINAVFNLRNFWDGRAQTIFNGVSPFGERDPNGGFYNNVNGVPTKVRIIINDASLASQAVGPLLNDLEMSATDRIIPDIGKRVIPMRMLANQKVAWDDSALGPYANLLGNGLKNTYHDLIKAAFVDSLWNANQSVTINGKQYSQMEANFSLFFGLAVQLYQATLISDETPFDKFAEGNTFAMSKEAQRGFGLFVGKAKCVACHDGALFSGAAITRDSTIAKTSRIERMLMGNNQEAVYDNGFYNIGVTRTEDDLGVGGKDPFGNPLSFSLLAKNLVDFALKEIDLPNIAPAENERVAVNGAFKTPGLRNVALTAPYMHNGSYLTLRSVVEFYNRGGNFPKNNNRDLDADIEPLNLTDQEMDDLVTFMEALTDPRVKKHAAPFDHPSLIVSDGFVGDGNSTSANASLPGRAQDITTTIPAVGRWGYASNAVPTFTERLGADHHTRGELTWAQCAVYGGVCWFSGTKEVRYVNSKTTTNPIKATTLTFCLPHMFGLPFTKNDGGRCEVAQ
jgi:cytochrome c peroxidase